jgi:hypothetical protein
MKKILNKNRGDWEPYDENESLENKNPFNPNENNNNNNDDIINKRNEI